MDSWIEFFSAMEGGHRISLQALMDQWAQELPTFGDVLCGDLADIPTVLQLETALRNVAPHKAIGPDAIPGEACHKAPVPLASLYFPILVKMAIFGMEPLAFKGGRLTMAWKRKGPQTSCSSFRSLLISSHPGKACHKALRDMRIEAYEQALLPDQLGGRRGTPVTLAVHLVRAHQRWCLEQKRCEAIIFLDLKEAFYRTLRELALGSAPGSQLHHWIQGLGLAQSTHDELLRQLKQPSAIHTAGFSAVHCNMVQAIHHCTWFYVQDQADRVVTSVGSRPGDCYADWVFGVLFARVLGQLEERLDRMALLEELPAATASGIGTAAQPAQTTRLLGPTWMDDLAIMVSAETADALISKVARVLSELLTVCLDHGMQPNTSPGKTEVMLHLTGAGSHVWRRRLFNRGGRPFLDIVTEEGTIPIHVTSHYKHLGGLLHHTTSSMKEAQSRFAQAHQAFSEHRKLLLQNKQLSLSQRTSLFDTMVMSKLLYGFSSLVLFKPKDESAMETALFKLYKRLLPGSTREHISKEALLARLELPTFRTLHRRERLRYYALALVCADERLWSLLRLDSRWIDLVIEDMTWMRGRLLLSHPLPDPREHMAPWHDLIRTRPKYWKKLVSRAVRCEVLQAKHAHQVRCFHQRFCTRVIDLQLLPAPHAARVVPADSQYFGCMHCQVSAKSKAGEAAHMFRCHGKCAKERWLYDSTQCAHCLKEFHTAAKIQRHLKTSHRCRRHLHPLHHLQAPLPGIGSQGDRALQHQHDDLVPVIQADGPHVQQREQREEGDWEIEIVDTILGALLPVDAEDNTLLAISERLRTAISASVCSWTICKASVHFAIQELQASDAQMIGQELEDVKMALLGITEATSWPFLLTEDAPAEEPTLNTTEAWEAHLGLHLRERGPDRLPAPSGFSAHRVIIHLFSGRRRPGDLQAFLERTAIGDGLTLHVVSIDLVFHERWGDLANPETQEWWLQQIRSGYIIGMLAGPPCSSWSKARGRIVEGKKFPPRILRTAQEPWGVALLAIRELSQLLEADDLMFFCLLAVLELWIAHGCAVLEHPACPDEEDRASIWRTLPMRWLLSLEGIELVHVWQGLHGAKSPKPTHMLALNLPQLPSMLRTHQVTAHLPSQHSIGVTAEGHWQTTSLKEYPPSLNCGLAEAFLSFARTAPIVEKPIPAEFWSTIEPMVVDYSAHMGMDFQR
eukprot:Skav232868  [mRNA]  locus=scaffold2451:249611:253189:+ [translate_table: standard]